MTRVRVEFTIEPFVDANPGPHVLAAWAAAEAQGAAVEQGPFSSEAVTTEADAPGIVAEVVRAAFAHGATHVSFLVDRLDGEAAGAPGTSPGAESGSGAAP